MTQVNATAKCYAYISSAWVELDDAGGASPLEMSWGIPGNSPLDRIADTGELRVALNNSTGLYTPGGPSALAGWKKGIPFKLVYTFESEDYIRFRGVVSDIDIKPGTKDKKCYLTVVDWLDYAAKHPVVNPGILTNQTGDQVITTAVSLVEIAPQATDYDTGIETFATAYDTTTSHTKVYSEMSKATFSELGYTYLRKDRGNGETLVFESADARPGSRVVDELPILTSESGAMLKEDSGYLLLETGGKILLNQTAATTFTSANIQDFDATYGEHVLNRMTVYAYPRRLSASPEVLFQLDEEIVIGSGQTYTLKGAWVDPQGGLPINAQDVIEPDPSTSTDCSAFTATGGGGSDITTDLTIVTWTPGTEGFTAILRNDNAATMFVYTFKPRATGIYLYNPIEHAATNSASIAEYETESETIHQKYQNTLYSGRVFVDSVVEEYKDPRTVLNSITFIANRSGAAMMAFLNCDVGQLHYIDIDELGLTGNYYIQGIEATMNGRIITVTWILVAALSITTGCGLTPVAVEYSNDASGDGVNFGYLPCISGGLKTRSFSVWIYQFTQAPASPHLYPIFSTYGGSKGILIYTRDPGFVRLHSEAFLGAVGAWRTPDDSFNLNQWVHVVVTFDSSVVTNDPVIYVNGVSQTVTETLTPAGAADDEIGQNFVIGNILNSVTNFIEPYDGKIFDPRVYNYILTQADVTAIYNGGSPSTHVGPTTGLIFQGFAVRTSDASSYVDQTLNSDTNLFEAQFKAVGTVHGAPVGRAAP